MDYKAPFAYFGAKRTVAAEVWSRFGNVAVYAEPFAGSLAVLLGRPGLHCVDGGWPIESVNDADGFLVNAWRAILHDPEATAHHADWPSFESDLHARHAWLTARRGELTSRLEGDPEWFDAKIAGWWLWGMAQWIGGGFCSGDGPWHRVEVSPGDWRLVKSERGTGSTCQGVNRKLVQLGDAGRGGGDAGSGECGLIAWLCALSDRLRRVRVCCGDWARIVTPSALAPGVPGVRGIFLDPPYSFEADRAACCYAIDSGRVAHAVREWCLGAPAEYRIALCGYAGEGHDVLVDAGWSVFAWTAKGGMSSDRGSGSCGNNERERIWFSPACLQLGAGAADRNGQLGLFA